MPLLRMFSRSPHTEQKEPLAEEHSVVVEDEIEDNAYPFPRMTRDAAPRRRKASKGRKFSRILNDSWLLEISSLMISIAAVTAAAFLLRSYNGRALQDWRHSFSLNAVLSFVAIVSKATMILVMGSVLSQSKWNWYSGDNRSRPLLDFQMFDSASRGPLGSLRMICQLKHLGVAHLAALVTILSIAFEPFTQQALSFPLVSETYGSNATVPVATEYSATDGSDVELSMKAAIYDGLFYSNISQTGASISTNCESGNCTFPSYSTLSVCSRCENVTSLVTTSADWNTDRGNMSLPNGLLLNASHASFASSTGILSTTKLSGVSQVLTNLSALGDIGFGFARAYECIVYFCGEVYHGDVSDGAFNETVDYATASGSTYTPPWATDITDPAVTITIPAAKVSSAQNISFGVLSATNDALQSFLSTILAGNVSGYATEGVGSNADPSSDIIQALFNKGTGIDSIPTTVANMAKAMSNHIRLTSDLTAAGTVAKTVTTIHILWLWLILPFVLELIAILVLVLTILVSRRRGLPAWKSSALASMHGLPQSSKGLLRTDEMEDSASRASVRFVRTRGTLVYTNHGDPIASPQVGPSQKASSSRSTQALSANGAQIDGGIPGRYT